MHVKNRKMRKKQEELLRLSCAIVSMRGRDDEREFEKRVPVTSHVPPPLKMQRENVE